MPSARQFTHWIIASLFALPAVPLPKAGAIQPQQSPLQALIDWKDGRLADGVGPADATNEPFNLRFWMGHGLSRAQINIDTRQRLFDEELGPDQNYPSAIRELELDEQSANEADHRLFVLTGWQKKADPPVLARIQYLSVEQPTAPSELHTVSIAPPLGSSLNYDIASIECIPEEKLLLAVGNAVDTDNYLNDKLLLILYRYGEPLPGGGEGLVELETLEVDRLPLRNVLSPSGVEGRVLIRLLDAEAFQAGGDWLAFVRGPMGKPVGKGNAIGLAAVRIDPDPAPLEPHLSWFEQDVVTPNAPAMVFDPTYDAVLGPQAAGWAAYLTTGPKNYVNELSVTHVDIARVDFAATGEGQGIDDMLYASCKRFNQVLEFDISSYPTTGFEATKKLDLTVPAPNAISQDSPYPDQLFYITTHHDLSHEGNPIDLLYVIGQQFMHVSERVPGVGSQIGTHGDVPVFSPLHAQTKQFLGLQELVWVAGDRSRPPRWK